MIPDPVRAKGPATPLRRRPLHLLLVCTCILFLGSDSRVKTSSSYHPDGIEGVWTDACPCTIPCTCWGTSKSEAKRCINVQSFHVDRGHYHGIDLTDATLILVSTPEEDFDSPIPRVLYVAKRYDRTDAAAALTRVFSDILNLRPRDGIRFVEMKTIIASDHQVVSIPNILTYAVTQHAGVVEPDSIVTDYLYSWLRTPEQWHAKAVSYLPAHVRYQGTNALYGRFVLSVKKEEMK